MKKLTEEKIREIIAPTIENLKRNFPEWDDEATDRLVEMLRPYNEGKIRAVCATIAKPFFVKQVVGHRAKHGARSVVSQEAKDALAQEDTTLSDTLDVGN